MSDSKFSILQSSQTEIERLTAKIHKLEETVHQQHSNTGAFVFTDDHKVDDILPDEIELEYELQLMQSKSPTNHTRHQSTEHIKGNHSKGDLMHMTNNHSHKRAQSNMEKVRSKKYDIFDMKEDGRPSLFTTHITVEHDSNESLVDNVNPILPAISASIGSLSETYQLDSPLLIEPLLSISSLKYSIARSSSTAVPISDDGDDD